MNNSPVFSLPATPLANSFVRPQEAALQLPRYPLSINMCPRCGHHQLDVVVNPGLMFADYSYASGTSASFRKHFDEYAQEIWWRYPKADRVLEVGSNDGTMIKALHNFAPRGGHVDVIGIEPAANLVMKCIADGLNVVRGYANESTIQHYGITADFFTANNVLAHVDDFVGTLKAIATTGATAGVFEVQYLGDLLRAGTFDMVYHEHLDYWRLTELVEQLPIYTPWKVVDVQRVPTHGGSLRVWVERSKSLTMASRDVAALYHEEGKRQWASEWSDLRVRMDLEHKRLGELLKDAKRIAVFGAPAKLTSLLYGLNLLSLNLSYVVDDSPLKQGLYSPGIGLPVHAPEALAEDPPDAVLIGAWNFAEHIKPRIERMLPGVPIVTPFEK